MNDTDRLRAEFDAEFLKDLAAAEAKEAKAKEAEAKTKERWVKQSEPQQEQDPMADLAPFTRAVVQTIQSIPEGKVMSYGQVASAAGSPRGARQVVRILHSLSRKYGLPWHRVVNIRGEIALDEDGEGGEQQARLEAEGVEFGLDGRIDLKRYRYQPDGELQAEDRKADDTKRVEKAKANRKG